MGGANSSPIGGDTAHGTGVEIRVSARNHFVHAAKQGDIHMFFHSVSKGTASGCW